MVKNLKIKVCGLTNEHDVDLAMQLGADYFGFIVYPKSPRAISLAKAKSLVSRVKPGRGVIVDFEPSLTALTRYLELGAGLFQIHFNLSALENSVPVWSETVGSDQLWLAPRIESSSAFPEKLLDYSNTILVDTFSRNHVGGTGKTGNWSGFAKWKQAHPGTAWVLAGGLSPENVTTAISTSGTEYIDVNSGVEKEPGKKDAARLRELFRVLRPPA